MTRRRADVPVASIAVVLVLVAVAALAMALAGANHLVGFWALVRGGLGGTHHIA